jgi:hypothetical protein
MAGRDPEDWPMVALALARSLSIWSQDNDMEAAGVTVFHNPEVAGSHPAPAARKGPAERGRFVSRPVDAKLRAAVQKRPDRSRDRALVLRSG